MKIGKKARLFIILIIVIAIAISGLVLFFKTDFFRTKRSAFFRYFDQMPNSLEILKTDKFDDYIEKKEDMSFIRDANISIQTSSNIADSAILDKIKYKVTEKSDKPNKKGSINVFVNNSDNELMNLVFIQNKDSYGFFSNDIANGFITVNNNNLKRIARQWGLKSTQLFPDEIRSIRLKSILDTSKNEKSHIDDCVKIIKNNVPNTAYSKDGKKKIKINNKSYLTTAYKLHLGVNDSANLQNDILEKVSKDSILMDYFASKAKLLNFDEEYTTINSLNKLMKERIENVKNTPSLAGEIEIIVYEYKQKNVRCDIQINGNKFCIDQLDEDEDKYSSIMYNNNRFSIEFDGSKYYFEYENIDDDNNSKKIRIEFNQEGSIQENNISNNMLITRSDGIRSITYLYSDNVNFTENIGKIDDYGTQNVAILNDYSDDDLKNFFEVLRKAINDVYIKKGAIIGINLDPIF